MIALLTMAWLFPSVFPNVLFQTSTLWFRPSVNLDGVGPQIDILTEMIVALGALVLLGSNVDRLMF